VDPLTTLQAALSNRYSVSREIGSGGMATVYLAHDLRHERQVALKVLKPELGAVLGVERFLSEIRVTAALQHPNLLPLFDSGEADGLLYYVMPFVDGETLRARLDREKQIPVDEAIAIARQVAGALEYAHRLKVIHRDLKPENILFQAGQPVLADFGIALAVANAGGARITQTGLSLGTPQYMSPEQATGDRVIDARTDIYSLAAVLYEMLTGEPPHTGATAQAIIARLLIDKPRSVRSSRATVPLHVDAAIDRALAKLPADRFSSALEFSQALTGAGFVATAVPAAASTRDDRASLVLSRRALETALKIAAFAAASALGIWGWLRPKETPPVLRARFMVELPDSLTTASTYGQSSVAISRDGSEITFPVASFGGTLYRRHLDDFGVTEIPGARGAWNPRYSPDGRWMALQQSGTLIKIPLAGGPAAKLAEEVSRADWGDSDDIVYTDRSEASRGGLTLVSGSGGPTQRLTVPDTASGEVSHEWPHVLPGGRGVVFQVNRGAGSDDGELAVVSLRGPPVMKLGVAGSNPRYVSTGHLLFARQDGSVNAVPFDLKRLQVTGPAITVLDGVVVKQGGAAMFAVSQSGTLAYIEGTAQYYLAEVGRTGSVRHLTVAPGPFVQPRWSPSGDRIAFTRIESSRFDIWVLTVATGQISRLTRDGLSRNPAWSSDGERIAWVTSDGSGANALVWQRADGSGVPDTIVRDSVLLEAPAMTPDGRSALIQRARSGQGDIVLVPLSPGSGSRSIAASEAHELQASVSPDGRWVAFASIETGRPEIFVASLENPAQRYQVSTEGGGGPMWDPDGRSLLYLENDVMVSARLTFSRGFEVVRRDTLFTLPVGISRGNHDLNPGTGAFVMLQRGDQQRERLVVVFGWLEELRQKMGATRR
jgi:serine/threonine-protein kinase